MLKIIIIFTLQIHNTRAKQRGLRWNTFLSSFRSGCKTKNTSYRPSGIYEKYNCDQQRWCASNIYYARIIWNMNFQKYPYVSSNRENIRGTCIDCVYVDVPRSDSFILTLTLSLSLEWRRPFIFTAWGALISSSAAAFEMGLFIISFEEKKEATGMQD